VTVLARRFASTPVRSTSQTWAAIRDVIAPDPGEARDELGAATGLMAMLIAEEATRTRPLIVSGSGPMVRIYTLHGEDALDDEPNETPLPHVPTTGSWKLALAVSDEDAKWVAGELERFPHLTLTVPDVVAAADTSTTPIGRPAIDLKELRTR
jgi:hypothetical protein